MSRPLSPFRDGHTGNALAVPIGSRSRVSFEPGRMHCLSTTGSSISQLHSLTDWRCTRGVCRPLTCKPDQYAVAARHACRKAVRVLAEKSSSEGGRRVEAQAGKQLSRRPCLLAAAAILANSGKQLLAQRLLCMQRFNWPSSGLILCYRHAVQACVVLRLPKLHEVFRLKAKKLSMSGIS